MTFLVNWLASSIRLAIGRHFDLWANNFEHGTVYGKGGDTRLIWPRGLDQMEYVVVPHGYYIPLGIDRTGHRQLIHTKLLQIKDIVLVFPY
jgi:hypothetical protein